MCPVAATPPAALALRTLRLLDTRPPLNMATPDIQRLIDRERNLMQAASHLAGEIWHAQRDVKHAQDACPHEHLGAELGPERFRPCTRCGKLIPAQP
jgi:hypothetical protein